MLEEIWEETAAAMDGGGGGVADFTTTVMRRQRSGPSQFVEDNLESLFGLLGTASFVFVENECGICCENKKDIIRLTECGHDQYCKECYLDYLSGELRGALDKFPVKCENHHEGCSSTVKPNIAKGLGMPHGSVIKFTKCSFIRLVGMLAVCPSCHKVLPPKTTKIHCMRRLSGATIVINACALVVTWSGMKGRHVQKGGATRSVTRRRGCWTKESNAPVATLASSTTGGTRATTSNLPLGAQIAIITFVMSASEIIGAAAVHFKDRRIVESGTAKTAGASIALIALWEPRAITATMMGVAACASPVNESAFTKRGTTCMLLHARGGGGGGHV
jgi:hypothetical protein